MAALPYMQLYVAEYLADTMHLTAIQHGGYLLLLMNYWQRGKALPNNDERLAVIAKMTTQEWKKNKELIAEFFTITETEWIHHRVERDLELVSEKSSTNKANGKLGGRPKKTESKPNGLPNGYENESESKGNRTEQIRTEEKTSRDKRESDPRNKSFKEVLQAYFDYHKLKMTWDGAEGKQLSSLLAANPEMTVDQFRTLLHNRTKSRGVNHSKRPSSWIRNATDYGAGPLNEFGQPINAPAPKAVQPLQAPLNALEELRARNRRAEEEVERERKQAS